MIRILVQGSHSHRATTELMQEYCDRFVSEGIKIKRFVSQTQEFETDNCLVKFISANSEPNLIRGLKNFDTVFGLSCNDRIKMSKNHTEDQPDLNLFDYIYKIEKGCI